MSRGVGVAESLARSLAPLEPLFALLTQLGDVWFLALLGLLAYCLGRRAPVGDWDRRRGLLVLGVALWAFAATYALKAALGLARPPGASQSVYALPGVLGTIYADAATGHGFGFPSGHAVGATAVYGTLAWLGPPDRRGRRLAVAGALVALVSLTRLALGVHYLVDVVVGVAVGLALAAVALRARAAPTLVVGLAAATAGGRLLLAPATVETAVILGIPLGAVLALWFGPAVGSERGVAPVVVAGTVAFAAALGLLLVGLPVVAGGVGALGAGVVFVGLPAVVWPENEVAAV